MAVSKRIVSLPAPVVTGNSTINPVASGESSPLYSMTTLDNGLRVLLHEDHSTPIVTIDVLYHVGSKNEERGHTGFAHLFEHLMFDGSKHVERGGYDRYCTSVGGDNNAFTSSDITNYYISLPSDQLPLGLWLEADRMAGFAIQDISLETQKSVVIEEKRQTTDDVPYGDAVTVLREISYDAAHPYSWETIGSMEDIAAASMETVRSFYSRFYHPSNAVLVVAGDIEPEETMRLVRGYFGAIPAADLVVPPVVNSSQLHHNNRRAVSSPLVPFNAVFLAYHTPSIYDRDIHVLELLSMILSEGESSRLYRALEYEQEIASEAESFIDDGELSSLFYIYAVAQNRKVTPAELEKSLLAEIAAIASDGVSERELQKVKNRKMTRITHTLQSISNRSERLAYFEGLFGDPMLAFSEAGIYEPITPEDIQRVARIYLRDAAPNVVEYTRARGKRR
jgi:predicted Zn-dependent peptidase